MKRAVEILLGEMKGKLGGYAVLLQYRYRNLCIKAEPAALLSLTVVNSEGEPNDIENVAKVILKTEFQFEIIPNEEEMVYPICKALMKSHPEFKQELVTPEDKDKLYPNDREERHIICTMPEVDKNRHDLLMDTVSTLYNECSVQLEKAHGVYVTKMTVKMESQSPGDSQEAMDAVDATYDQHKDIIKQYKELKEKEIEEAYQRWLAVKQEKELQQQEEQAARNDQAGLSMRFDNNN